MWLSLHLEFYGRAHSPRSRDSPIIFCICPACDGCITLPRISITAIISFHLQILDRYLHLHLYYLSFISHIINIIPKLFICSNQIFLSKLYFDLVLNFFLILKQVIIIAKVFLFLFLEDELKESEQCLLNKKLGNCRAFCEQ